MHDADQLPADPPRNQSAEPFPDLRSEENNHISSTENVKIQYSSMEQKDAYISENISRIQDEIGALAEEELEIKDKIEQTNSCIC